MDTATRLLPKPAPIRLNVGHAAACAPADTAFRDLGAPRLSISGAAAQSLAVGPVFSIGFLSGTVAVFAGFNTPLSVLIGGLGALALAYTVSLYARRIAGAGAIYEYLGRGLHPGLGVLGGGIYLLGLMFLGAGGGFVAEGLFIDDLLSARASVSLGWWFWSVVAVVLVIGINWLGVRIGTGFIAVLAVVSAVPFLVIAAAIFASVPHAASFSVFDPSHTSLGSVSHGVLFAISLYVGFEAVASLGEEVRRPWRDLPIAMIGTVSVCLIFYVVMTYAATIGFGEQVLRGNAWYASGNPFGQLGMRYVDSSLGWIVSLAIIVDLGSVLIAFTLSASRLLMVFASDQLLPRPVARTSLRFQSPIGGLVVIAGWALLLIAVMAGTHFGDAAELPDVLEAVLIMSATGSYLITLIYLVLAAGALRLLFGRTRKRLWLQVPVVLVAIGTPILALVGSLDPFPSYPDSIAVFAAAAGLLLCLAWYMYLALKRPGTLERAASRAVMAQSDTSNAGQ